MKERLGEEAFNGILQDLESYLIRRAVCDLTPKNYNKIFLSLLKSVSSKKQQVTRKSVQAELLSMQGESQLWPDDALFNQNWLNAPLYSRWPSNRTRMVLEALEAAIHTSKQEYFPFDDPLTNPLTIEHIMPQWGKEEDWPAPLRLKEGESVEEAKYRRERLIHSIGNLTLLTQPLNSSVSNGSFKNKRSEITKQSRLQLNAYFQRFDDKSVWDEKAILKRGRELFDLASRAWPFPH